MDEMPEDLDEWMSGDPGDDVEPGLADQAMANAILRRKGGYLRKLARQEDLYQAELERLTEWITWMRDHYKEKIADADHWLAGWHQAQLGEHNTGPKTISLPAGTLKATKQQPEWEIEDETAFLAWADKRAPELVRRPEPKEPKPAPDRMAIKARYADIAKRTESDCRPGESVRVVDGDDEVPGLVIRIRGPRFEAKPATP